MWADQEIHETYIKMTLPLHGFSTNGCWRIPKLWMPVEPQVADVQVAVVTHGHPQVADVQAADPQVADPQIADPKINELIHCILIILTLTNNNN